MKNFLSFVFCLLFLTAPLAVLANAYTLADAERAYVTKDWTTAKAAYSAVCPTLAGSEQVACTYWHTLALSQTGKAADFKAAGKKLDSLISKVSPMDSLYSDLVMTRAQFEIYLKKYKKARESLRHATETAKNPQSPALLQVCGILQNVDKSAETDSLCEAMKNGTLVTVLADSADTAKVAIVKVDSVKTDSVKVDSVKAVLAKADTAKQDSIKPEMVKTDSAKVDTTKMEPVKAELARPDSSKVETAKEAVVLQSAETYSLQVGAFSKKENADMLVAALKSRNIEVHIVERISTDRVLYLVHTVPFPTRKEAMEYGENVLTPLKMEFSPVKNP